MAALPGRPQGHRRPKDPGSGGRMHVGWGEAVSQVAQAPGGHLAQGQKEDGGEARAARPWADLHLLLTTKPGTVPGALP